MLLFDPRTHGARRRRGERKDEGGGEEAEAHSRRRVDPSRGLVRYVTARREREGEVGRRARKGAASNFSLSGASSLRQTNCPSCGETRGSPPFDRGPVTRGPLFVESRVYAKRRRRYDRGTSGSMGWSTKKERRRTPRGRSEFDEGERGERSGKLAFHRFLGSKFCRSPWFSLHLVLRNFNRELYFSSFSFIIGGVDCRFAIEHRTLRRQRKRLPKQMTREFPTRKGDEGSKKKSTKGQRGG